MKKLFIALMACAAVVSCSKSDIVFDNEQSEIAFSPVAQNTTKSVAGYDGDTFDGVFPTDIDLYVWANAQDETGGVLAQTWNTAYFKNALFKWTTEKDESSIDDVAKGGAYAGTPVRYWPNVKSLKFAGVSKACNVNAETNGVVPTMDDALSTLTINGYTQDNTNTAEGANDLMWFPLTSYYSKQAIEVPVTMKHACSWITINVYGDDVTANNWKLNSLLVKSINHTGNVACATTATWNTLSESSDEYYYDNGTSTFTNTADEYAATANNFIVIPQTPTSLDVTYTYTSQEAVGTQAALTLTETKNVPLNFDTAKSNWQPGVHYIYNVKITATEILIDPKVVEWTAYTANNINKDTE